MDHDMSTEDLFTGDELAAMDRDDELRMDAADEARYATEDDTQPGDDAPFEGLADGEER
ncbi:hypothetical protein [Streptomyces tagetis]|uniref:Uncharacterized protein n=1 Tax=Streptomyces tagetis TaxID=2820809 RepID=A0A941AYN5_9ACTN|nr:hypothetical protein [Streptomyces sp. RG38]MBQ0827694.1 hypothetical protein [Streptomyces sp. RG38]